MKIPFAWPLLLVLAPKALAHSEATATLPQEGFRLDLGAVTSYRSDSLVKSGEAWVIPGVLMGGEALPSQKGISLDEAFLVPSFRQNKVYGYVKLGRHLGSDSFEMDHVLLGYQAADPIFLEFGKLSGAFTPFNGVHAMDTAFSSRRLVYDALWGGQYNDEGLRIKALLSSFEFGLELWKGRNFPVKQLDTNKSAADAYARYVFEGESLFLELGAYGFQGSAGKRDDSRYASGHSHGGTTITLDPSYFSGDVKTYGFHYQAGHKYANGLSLRLQGEFSQMSQEGQIWDLTHQAQLASKIGGVWTELHLAYGKNAWAYRGEKLRIQNDISGASALTLAQKLDLDGVDEDPYRHTLSYERSLGEGLRARIEGSKDFSTRDKKEIVTLGLIYSETLFQSATKED